MKSLLLALTATLGACSAPADAGPVTPATLRAAFDKAAPGDTLMLAPGSYGDVDFARRFPKPVTITCADKAHPPSFNKLSVSGSSYLTFSCVNVDFAPDAKTVTYSWATRIQESDHITFKDVRIVGGPAIAGLNEDGSGADVGGNIIGRPTAYGVLINHASDVLIDGGEVAGFHKGVMLQWTQKVTIRGVELHDMRTTAIVGADNSDLTIENNYLHSAHPWRWGHGDHADLLALWSNGNQTTPNARVRIVNNRMEQMAGEAILGMWLQGSQAAPFTDFEITGNQIVVNNLQGILINNSHGGVIADNRLYRATKGDDEQSPTVLLRENTTGVTLKGNQLGAEISDLSKGDNPAKGNSVARGDRNIFKTGDRP
jgi:hypothetical protein